jgi:CheY-like chemotaxis protein
LPKNISARRGYRNSWSFSKHRGYSVAPGSYISIKVSDTGKGIDEQLLQHIFEPFFTTKDTGKGIGLGLSSVYGTVKSHQGYIDVKSEEGKGTTFTIFIPVCSRKDSNFGKQETDKKQDVKHILLMDDQSHALDEAVEIISWLGYRVSIVHNCYDALNIVKEQKTDLIIIDIVAFNTNGRDCLKKIRAIDSSVKVLLSAGSRNYEEEQELSKYFFAGEIRKPFISSQVALVLSNALNSLPHSIIQP